MNQHCFAIKNTFIESYFIQIADNSQQTNTIQDFGQCLDQVQSRSYTKINHCTLHRLLCFAENKRLPLRFQPKHKTIRD